MICPFCAEEIKDEAKKCRYCGEWLDSDEINAAQLRSTPDIRNQELKLFRAKSLEKGGLKDGYKIIYAVKEVKARDEEEARDLFFKNNEGMIIDDYYGIREVKDYGLREVKDSDIKKGRVEGKFSCPSCKSKYTECNKNIGCAVLIIIFVSLGIGLIMIPFLPYHCECMVCGHKWKS